MPIEARLDNAEERLNKQDDRMNTHDKKLEKQREEIEKQQQDIEELTQYGKKNHERLLAVEGNYERLESTVLKENKETRATMREQTEKLFAIVQQAMGYQETRTSQSHEIRMAKLNTWSAVFLKISGGIVALLSAGGAGYFIIQSILER